jgi:hypothetical protein
MRIVRSILAVAVVFPLMNTGASAQGPLTALQTCLGQNASGNALKLENVQVVTNQQITGSTWVISCDGTLASQLWNQLYPYRQNISNWTSFDNSKRETIYVGNLSNCTRVLYNPNGTPGTYFYCNIMLDLTPPVVQGLR